MSLYSGCYWYCEAPVGTTSLECYRNHIPERLYYGCDEALRC